MTAGHLVSAVRGLSVRATFGLLSAAAGIVVAALSLFLVLGLVPGASHIRQSTEPVVFLVREMNARAQAAEVAVRSVTALTTGDRAPQETDVQRVRSGIAALGPAVLRGYAAVPGSLRAALARTDDEIARIEVRVDEVLAMLEMGRLGEARARVTMADSLLGSVEANLAAVERQDLEDLVAREVELEAASRRAIYAAALLVAAAILLPALFIVTVIRRIDRPLLELTSALDRVGTGDLTATLPVRRRDELGRLGEHFNAMTRVLRDRAEGQGRFAATGDLLAGMAHEVNNPLQAITALAELRLEQPDLPAPQRSEYRQILEQGRRAAKLLGGLLHFVRPGEPRVETLDLADLVARVVDLLSYQFGVDEIQVDNRVSGPLPPVRGDAARVEQLFVNLLSNAIDAVREIPTPRRITVEAWEHSGRMHIAVADNGRGVAPEVAARLFQPFVSSKGMSGTGLGLYVSRQLARELDGDLQLRSTPGEGARFVAWFPAAGAAERFARVPPKENGRTASNGAPKLANLTVLLVDDEEAVRRPLGKGLGRLGASVVEAGDGLEALAQLGLFAVDVIVLDLRMPRMDGVAFYAVMRRDHPQLAERIVFLSGDPGQLSAAYAGALPQDRVLEKPVDLDVLAAAVRRVSGRFPG